MEYFTTAAGITVHLLDTQDSKEQQKEKCIILLHGYLETLNIWNELVERLKDKYRVIVLDMPGHGLTDSAPAREDGTVVNTMEFGADVVKALIEKCGARNVTLGGHSMGGYVTLAFCKKYPDVIEKAKNGDLVGWSFGFKDIKVKQKKDGEILVRDVNDIDLVEVSILDRTRSPAYKGNTLELVTRNEDGSTLLFSESFLDENFKDSDCSKKQSKANRENTINYSECENIIKDMKGS